MKLTLAPDMTSRRAEAETRVDNVFRRRLEKLVVHPELYRRKVEEAHACLDHLVFGHLIAAEVAQSGRAPDAIAHAILARAAACDEAVGALEAGRLAFKAAIRAAATPAALDAALTGLEPYPA